MIRIAILDLYDGLANQGMRCLREILKQFSEEEKIALTWEEFDVRQKKELPDQSYNIYISSGGPGSPLESHGTEWEKLYFEWLANVEAWNKAPYNEKKYIFFICHSFQLACRHYNIGNVCSRKSTAFGVFPVHMLDNEIPEPVFEDLKNPFYAVDSRDYQVIQPNHKRLREMGATILCIEKERPHVALERAIMGIRFNQYFIGTQFHPEADSEGMSIYLQLPEKQKTITENYGEEKWQSMIEQLNDPEKISYTHNHILPNFLKWATASLVTKSK